jgi:hypothetical protein
MVLSRGSMRNSPTRKLPFMRAHFASTTIAVLNASVEVFNQHQVKAERITLREQNVPTVRRNAEANPRRILDVEDLLGSTFSETIKL